MDAQRIIDAARREAERQNVALDVQWQADTPEQVRVMLTLAQRAPATLGVHVVERIETQDRPR